MKPTILIIEDEEAIVLMLKYTLEKEGFDVISAESGELGLELIAKEKPSLVLLDWMLPGISGVDVCKEMRKDVNHSDIPVIMLTARSEEADKVKGLSIGADDYMTKPFSVLELVARIKALLRRFIPVVDKGSLEFADVVLDINSRKVTRAGRSIVFGPTEFRLLLFFMKHPRKVFSRDDLLREIWGSDIHVELRTVDVHIRRLRKALNQENEMDYIRTIRSGGYSLDDEKLSED